jgi:hypothetical protein
MGFKGWNNLPGLKVTNANGFSDLQMPVQNQSENKKVKNATKHTYDGIVFDSKLEMLAYQRLKGYGFDFNMKDVIELVKSFMFNGKLVKSITMEPDFNLDVHGVHIIVETKGNPNDVYPYKLKLLKQKIMQDNYVYEYGDTGTTIILFIHLQKQLDDFFENLHAFKKTANPQNLKYLIEKYSHYESEATVKRRKKKSKEYREKKKLEKNGAQI